LELGSAAIATFPTLRSAKLLVLLGLSRSGKIRREALADLLWPDDYYDATKLRLRQEIHRLRKALGPADEVLTADLAQVGLDRSEIETDLEFLRKLQSSPRLEAAGDPALTEDFLPGWEDTWVLAERAAAGVAQRLAASSVGSMLLQAGQFSDALNLAQAMIARFPLEEGPSLLAVEAHAALGCMAAAVAEYQQFRRRLREDGDSEPSESMEARVQEVMRPAQVSARSNSWSTEIPAPIDRFVGRQEELTLISQFLWPPSQCRLVTLVGPGGIGKTRLSLEAARCLAPEFGGRIAMALLADVDAQSDWLRTILEQLHCHAPAEASPNEVLSRVLGGEPTLLVLDNLEHLPSELAQGILHLLEMTPRLAILATSRSPLRLPGEQVITIGPLDPHRDGKELLIEGLRAARPIAASLGASDDALDQLAQKLDGYPLAIRLASARFRTLNPAALLDQLNQNPGFLRSDTAGTNERHRSLDAALGSSWEALDPESRRALSLVALCPSGVGIELAQRLLGSEDVIDQLEKLVDSAMLAMDDQGNQVRFRMLAPIREFVCRQASPEELEGGRAIVSQAVAERLTSIGVPPAGPIPHRAFATLESEQENVAVTWEWALTHDHSLAVRVMHLTWVFELARGRHLVVLSRLESLRPHLGNSTPWERASAALARCATKSDLHREEEAIDDLEYAQTMALESEDIDLQGAVWLQHALIQARRRQTAEPLEGAAQFFAQHPHPFREARLRGERGLLAHLRGKSDEAIALLERALQGYAEAKDVVNSGIACLLLGSIHAEAGRDLEAMALIQRSHQGVVESGASSWLAYLHEVEGRLHLSKNRAVEAENSFRASLQLWEQRGSNYQIADQLLSLARSLLAQDRFEEASDALVRSADLWYLDRNDGGLCQSITSAAVLLSQRGDLDAARRAITFSYAFHEAKQFGLTKSEMQFRDLIASRLGHIEPWEGETDLAIALEVFKPLRR